MEERRGESAVLGDPIAKRCVAVIFFFPLLFLGESIELFTALLLGEPGGGAGGQGDGKRMKGLGIPFGMIECVWV